MIINTLFTIPYYDFVEYPSLHSKMLLKIPRTFLIAMKSH